MLFTNKPKSNLSVLLLNRENIKIIEGTKFLGVIYDSKINFKSHISKLGQRLSRTSGLLYQAKKLAPPSILKCLYYVHIILVSSTATLYGPQPIPLT